MFDRPRQFTEYERVFGGEVPFFEFQLDPENLPALLQRMAEAVESGEPVPDDEMRDLAGSLKADDPPGTVV